MSLKSDIEDLKEKTESLRAQLGTNTLTKITTLGTIVTPKGGDTPIQSESDDEMVWL